MQQAGSSFAGAAFHCYAGSVSNQAAFIKADPTKEVRDKIYPSLKGLSDTVIIDRFTLRNVQEQSKLIGKECNAYRIAESEPVVLGGLISNGT